jgi:signal transduction histidine kinase
VGRRLLPLLDAAVPLLALVVVGSGLVHTAGAGTAPGAALAAAACLALAARRRAPVATVAGTGALASAVLMFDPVFAPYALLVPAAALFSLALVSAVVVAPAGSRARRIVGGVGALAVTLAAEAVNDARPGLLFTAQHLAILAVPILAAEGARTHRSYRSVLGERLALLRVVREHEAQRRVQEERLRIARDLHDVVAHTLTTINVQSAVAGHLLERRPELARDALAVIEDASREAIGELRAILGVLRDPDDPAAGRAPRAPAPGIDDVAGLVDLARGAGLRAELDVRGERPARLPDPVSRAAYRIVQESLTNAARHTAGASVRVALAYEPDALAIDVENSAAVASLPAPPVPPPVSGGVGILGMTERAEALGGTLRTSASPAGFAVAARLPYEAN